MYVLGNIEARSCNHCCCGKAMSIAQYQVVYLQCACATWSFVTCPALHYFSTFSHKRHDFRKKILEIKMCFDFVYKFCLKHFSFQEELGEM